MNNIKEIAAQNETAWGDIAEKIDENFSEVSGEDKIVDISELVRAAYNNKLIDYSQIITLQEALDLHDKIVNKAFRVKVVEVSDGDIRYGVVSYPSFTFYESSTIQMRQYMYTNELHSTFLIMWRYLDGEWNLDATQMPDVASLNTINSLNK